MLGCREQKGNGRVEGHPCTSSYAEPSSEHSTSVEVYCTSCTLCTAMHPEEKRRQNQMPSFLNFMYNTYNYDIKVYKPV